MNTNILGNIPPVRRARGYYLYSYEGKRILDFYQNKGAAVLGHRPKNLSLHIKNLISKGLWADYPSVESARLLKKLHEVFPNFKSFRWYRDNEQYQDAL